MGTAGIAKAGIARLLLGLALAAALAGCLQEAEDKDYPFNNAADTTPSSGGSAAGNVHIVLVAPIQTELVVLANVSTVFDVDIKDWTLSSDKTGTTTEVYKFKAFTLFRGQFVRFHSASGSDTSTDVYGTNVDNWISTDTVTLKDNTGIVIDSCASTSQTCWAN
ncbi:MAG: lamin tail domain-containing protein [Candidatus Lambdaproteobacteria bacterium]|nr:lamin tail domain-containing protein [Candidatus Lambdaproteobacteria bacterium]